MEQVLLRLAGQVAGAAFARVLAKRRGDRQAGSELKDLVETQLTDVLRQREFKRHVETITDVITQRLRQLCRNELNQLDEGEQTAAAEHAIKAFEGVDLSDAGLFAADMNAEAVAARVLGSGAAGLEAVGLGEAGLRFYELLVQDTSECLVQLIEHLPAYQPRAITELLKRSGRIEAELAAALNRLPVPSLFAPQGTGLDEEFRARYLRAVSESLDELELFGVDVRNFRARTTLSVAYIGLSVRTNQEAHDPRDPQRWLTERGDQPSERVVRVEEVLGRGERILIRGEAGSGKSTLLRWLAINAARSGFSAELAALNGMVPVVVKLRSWEGERLPKPEELLSATVPELAGLMPQGFMHRTLEAGQVLLLVDGVDELPSSERPQSRKWLTGLLNAFPGNRVVVTSRPSAAAANWLGDDGFAPAMLERMSPSDVRELVRHWHSAIRDAGNLPCRAADLPEYERAILTKLDASADLRAMATTPLLCAMLCALNLDRKQNLPHNRIELYQATLAMLIDRRDAERRITVAIPRLGQAEKRTLLRDLAWRLSINQRSELRRDMAVERVSRKLESMPTVDQDAAVVFDYLLERSGVIREPQSGRIDFVHRTFQEFLTADQAADNGDMGLLVANSHKDQWQEIVRLAAGLAKAPDRAELLMGLLDRAQGDNRYARRLRILAASCLGTVSDIAPKISSRIFDDLATLLPPRRRSEATALAGIGAPLLQHLPCDPRQMTEAAASSTIWTAAWINGPEALPILKCFATDKRYGVQLALAAVWGSFEADTYAKEVLSDAPLADGWIVITDPEQVSATRHLRRLTKNIVHLRNVPHLSILDTASKLDSLTVTGDFDDITALERHPDLTDLDLGSRATFNPTPLTRLPKLRQLGISLLNLTVPRVLGQLTELASLTLNDVPADFDFNLIESLRQLKVLGVRATPHDPLSRLPTGFGSFITRLPNLISLSLSNWTLGNDLEVIAAIPRLDSLILERVGHFSEHLDLSPLADREMTVLVSKNHRVHNIGPNINLRYTD